MDDDSSAGGAFWRDVQREVWSVCCVGGRRTERSDAKSRSRGGLIILCGMCALLRLWTNHWEWIFKWDNYKLIISLLQSCVPQFSPFLFFSFGAFGQPTRFSCARIYLRFLGHLCERFFSLKIVRAISHSAPAEFGHVSLHIMTPRLWRRWWNTFFLKKVVCSFFAVIQKNSASFFDFHHPRRLLLSVCRRLLTKLNKFPHHSSILECVGWDESAVRHAVYCKSSKNQELALSLWNVHRRKKMCRKSSTHYRRKKIS